MCTTFVCTVMSVHISPFLRYFYLLRRIIYFLTSRIVVSACSSSTTSCSREYTLWVPDVGNHNVNIVFLSTDEEDRLTLYYIYYIDRSRRIFNRSSSPFSFKLTSTTIICNNMTYFSYYVHRNGRLIFLRVRGIK